jgi:hypothetical protein
MNTSVDLFLDAQQSPINKIKTESILPLTMLAMVGNDRNSPFVFQWGDKFRDSCLR